MVAPVMFLVVFGIFEFGRALMVEEILNTAARAGCRAGTLPGTTNSSVTTAVNNTLPGISGATTSILVNGAAADVSTAATGDSITIRVSVPYTNVSYLPSNSYLGNATLSASAAMPRE